MGNCSLKGSVVTGECPGNVRVVTSSGGIIELKGPKLAKDVLVGYPGYGIFKQGQASSSPLSSHEYLVGGQFYYLHPLQDMPALCDSLRKENTMSPVLPSGAASDVKYDQAIEPAPAPALQVLPSQGNGVWKVKLVIKPNQLEEILSEEGNTEALIEKMRSMAAASSLSAGSAPRRSKSSWGARAWKPCVSNVFKVSPVV